MKDKERQQRKEIDVRRWPQEPESGGEAQARARLARDCGLPLPKTCEARVVHDDVYTSKNSRQCLAQFSCAKSVPSSSSHRGGDTSRPEMAWGEERRNKVIGACLAMGMMVTLLWHEAPETASSLLSDSTVTARRPGSAASKHVSGSTRVHHVHMLQAAGDRLHVLAERGESLLTLVTDELEEACSDEDNWAQFCKNRAEDEDYAEKWEPFCSKKLAPTPECDQEKQSQHELKIIHEELIKSCHDVILKYLSVYGPIPGTCNASAPQEPACQVAFCKQLIATEHEYAAAASPSAPTMAPGTAASECDSIQSMAEWLQCEQRTRSATAFSSNPKHISLAILRLWTCLLYTSDAADE